MADTPTTPRRALTMWLCPDCGCDRGPIPQYVYRRCPDCGSHRPQREVPVVPVELPDMIVERLAADLLADAVAIANTFDDGLRDEYVGAIHDRVRDALKRAVDLDGTPGAGSYGRWGSEDGAWHVESCDGVGCDGCLADD